MKEIKVYNDIANHREGLFMSALGYDETVFSADAVRNLLSANKQEKDFKFNIHCNGGSTTEGFAIYDILRTSGKTIHANIDGSCHSMAMILLLAAPYENRTANRNARGLIHRVYASPMNYLNADQLEELAQEAREEEDMILDIYENRTGESRKVLENLMREEKIRTANELLQYGFISKINDYTTNKNFNKMSNEKNKNKKRGGWLSNLLGGSSKTLNYDFKDGEGNVMFSTPVEDDTLEVGMEASPDGAFGMDDGRTVVIEGGFITEIFVDASDAEDLANELVKLQETINKQTSEIAELKNQLGSNYVVPNRSRTPGKKNIGVLTTDELKNSVREKRDNWKNRKESK